MADLCQSEFRRSSYCSIGACVEVATTSEGEILVRDSKQAESGILRFTVGEWAAFVSGVKAGEFDI